VRFLYRALSMSVMLSALGAGLASAQTIDFLLTYTVPGQAPVTFNNDTLLPPFSAQTTQATITAEYIGSSQATIAAGPQGTIPWLVGSTEFTLSVPTTVTFPLVLNPGQKLSFTIAFTPSSSNTSAAGATITIPYTEPNTASGATSATVSSAIVILVEGTSPAVSFAYAFSNGNTMAISPGSTITFPPTTLNTSATATLAVINTGSGAAEITGITYPPSTSPFQVSGVPLASTAVPYTLNAGATPLEIGITYTPTAQQTDTGQITFTFVNGTTDTINLAGSGISTTLSFSYLSGSSTTPISLTPSGTITFAPVAVATAGTTASSSTDIVQVKNTGTTSVTINSVSVSGPFASTTAQTFPITLSAGGTTSFTISYTPTAVGSCSTNSSQCGTLVIGNAVFQLSGTGLGPQLGFSYTSSGQTVSIGTNGEVVFPSIAVSKSESVTFTITNSGTTATTVTLVTVSPNPPFSVPSLPPTPLAPGNSTSFAITFAPTVVGPASGTLQVNGTSITLLGGGTAPPALPSYTISGPSGSVSPATQAPVSLTLGSSYPVDLTGVLTLTTSGTLGTDPAVQFSTGSRTVDFTIPSGGTQANFAGQGSQIFVQTGTVAESVTLTPSFTTSGGVPITPTSPPTLQFTIPSSVPVIESLQVTNATGSQTGASFDVVVTGYTTTRDLGTLTVGFTAASGFNLTSSQTSVDVSGPSRVWFQSSTSIDSYGGLFQVTESFTFTGTAPKNQTLLEAIASLSATISNSVGTSASSQVNLQ